MNFAVIGTNFVTDWFLEAGNLCDEFSLVAVYSRTMARAKEYADKHGAKYVFDNLDELCQNKDVDAVYIASPTSLHASQSTRLMNAGKHILCEKPIASNSYELKSMLECAKNNKVVLLEAMRPQFSPVMKTIEDTMKLLGTIRYVCFIFNKYSSRYDRFLAGEAVNTFDPKFSNGALIDLGCYCISILLRLFGKPDKIQGSAVKLSNGIDAAGGFIASYNEMCATVGYSKISDTYNYCEIQGEHGTLRFREPSDLREVYLTKRGAETEHLVTPMIQQDMIYELKAFISYVKDVSDLETYHNNSIAVMEILDEIRKQICVTFDSDS